MKTSTLLVGIMLFTGTYSVSADTYPYERAGIINSIHADNRIVVIQDVSYRITSYTTVYEDGNKKLGPEFLSEGQAVGFNSSQNGNRPQIREIWILDEMPDDMSRINTDRDE